MGEEPERLAVTVEEAAEMLSISRAHCYTLVRAGEIPARRLGRRWIVPLVGLRAWAAEQTQAAS
jgi:excisionase family DNA binding protein